MSKYEIQNDPNHPCYGHPCDNCEECSSGGCCGDLVEEADLPEEGSWPVTHGTIGVLAVNSDSKLQCHACGDWFEALYLHVRRSHKITATEYRSYFGLGCGTSLAGPRLQEKRSQAMRKMREDGKIKVNQLPELTGEQRSLISWRRVHRAEYRNPFDDPAIQQKAQENRRRSLSDPEKFKAYRKKIIAKRPRRADNSAGLECPYCKALFCNLRGLQRKTCGSEKCKTEAKRQAQIKSRAALRSKTEST